MGRQTSVLVGVLSPSRQYKQVLDQSGERGDQETAHGNWQGGWLSIVCGSVPSVSVHCLSTLSRPFLRSADEETEAWDTERTHSGSHT